MNTKSNAYPAVLSAFIVLFAASPLLAQVTPAQRLTQAYSLEREAKPAAAISDLRQLLESRSLDEANTGKAWDILGLAYQDQGDFALARHAYEQSLRILETLPESLRDYGMALDDFGELYVTSGQFEIANQLRTRAIGVYEKLEDHTGMARVSSHLAGAAFSQKNLRDGSRYLKRAEKEAQFATDLVDDDRAAIASLQGWQAALRGDSAGSIISYRRSIDLLRKQHGEEHPSTAWAYVLLGQAQAAAGELPAALEDIKRGVAVLDRTLSHNNPHYVVAEMAYSRVLDAAGCHSEAAQIKAVTEPLLQQMDRSQCAGCTVSAAAFH